MVQPVLAGVPPDRGCTSRPDSGAYHSRRARAGSSIRSEQRTHNPLVGSSSLPRPTTEPPSISPGGFGFLGLAEELSEGPPCDLACDSSSDCDGPPGRASLDRPHPSTAVS
jgi:hypothetical protein